MPFYDYVCLAGHLTEKRGGFLEAETLCSTCLEPAKRRAFNLVAIVGETVMREQKYRVSEFLEASQEVDYAYRKAEAKKPDLYKQALKKARM